MTDLASGITPSKDITLFISYARADDEKPPFEDTVQGWVGFFWENLRWELSNAGLHQANLWLDRYDIEPAEEFTAKIDAALKEANIIVPILSPNWLSRPWCLEELNRFVKYHSEGAAAYVVPVKKRELPPGLDIPPVLRNREGYKFFAIEKGGQIREFYWRGLQDKASYLGVLKQMSEYITDHVLKKPPVAPVRAKTGSTIYLAVPAYELRDAWRRLANDLVGAGHVVLPAEMSIPESSSLADDFIRSTMRDCKVSVHLIGENEGMKPLGSDEGIVRRQLQLAREHASTVTSFPRILWVPRWLPERKDSKRDPIEVVKSFGPVAPGEEIYAEELTDLSQWLRGWVNQSKREAAQARVVLVASGSGDDDELVSLLANRLQSEEIKIKAVFAHDPIPPADAVFAEAVIILWGQSRPDSIDALLTSMSPRPKRIIVLWLRGSDELSKKHFFREGVYAEPLEAIPSDRKAARELLLRLEIVRLASVD